MFDSLAVVDPGVRLGQAAYEQALICTEHPVIELDLKKDTENFFRLDKQVWSFYPSIIYIT